MIEANNVSFKYKYALGELAIKKINKKISKGQVILLCGESGSGKTTFIRLLNGLIPNFYEGDLEGAINMLDMTINNTALHTLAPFVGSVFQDPKSQFYTLETDTEIVFACENLGMNKEEILNRFDKAVIELNIKNLVGKSLFSLSGGEKQKIACASVHALLPEVFVLDEPSSNLDISTIHDLKKILLKWKNQGKTIIIAEHRLTWLKEVADRILYFKDGEILEDIDADYFWRKTKSDFKSMGLRSSSTFYPKSRIKLDDMENIVFKDISVSIKNKKILEIPYFKIPKGSIVAVLGNNGSGKTTFARWMCGLIKKSQGTLLYDNQEYKNKKRTQLCHMVMQDVNHQLFSESVFSEVLLGNDKDSQESIKLAENTLQELDLLPHKKAHPMSLSGGQRQRVAIATAIVSHKDILIFDEPTSGLDYRRMKQVAKNIDMLSKKGKTQFIITHDAELVEACCDYFIFLEKGKILNVGSWDKESIQFISNYFKVL